MFYGSSHVLPKSKISDCISHDIPPQMKIFNTFIPFLKKASVATFGGALSLNTLHAG